MCGGDDGVNCKISNNATDIGKNNAVANYYK